jgi:hypothetical protein
LALLQVDDVSAEIERIRSQPESQRATLKQQADIMAVLIRDCQFDQLLAAKLAGLAPEQLALIQAAGAVEPPLPLPARGNGGAPAVAGG